MSYQFSDRDDKITSPLDRRQQSPYPPGQLPSFTTNVNRSKTKKWVEAKQVSYGGDDWDDYDEDDEYGVTAEPVDEPQASSSHARNFTAPVPATHPKPSQLQRSNSFEHDDENRAFSATTPTGPGLPRSPGPPLHVDTSVPSPAQPATDSASVYSTNALRQVSSASFAASATSDNSMNPENRRDYSPSAMPPPLKTPATALPPRKDSIGSSAKVVLSPTSPTSPAKAPTIIRPAEIYKRMEEERERERRSSLESSRSQDVASPTKLLQDPVRTDSPGHTFGRNVDIPEPRLESSYRMGAPLETVAERKSEYGLPGLPVSGDAPNSGFTGLSLPSFESGSNFGSFWDSPSNDKPGAVALQSTDDSLQHQPSVGYRSVVNQAFDSSAKISKQDSTRSQAATESSGITRSDTSGTSDISPIMSRVPSSAASAMKLAEQRGAPPAIEEEPEQDDRGRARTSAEASAPADVKPGFRRDLNPPSGTNSPARSPAVETRTQLRDPAAAELLTSPASDKAADSSFREADLAVAASSSPDKLLPPVAALERAAQDTFVATHDVPTEASPSISRAESPTKGRVADLTGKFNEVADSRRNSTHSLESKKSASSLRDIASRPSSAHGTNNINAPDKSIPADRPVPEREVSFRPKLPGGFESYASTASAQDTTGTSTPSLHPNNDQSKEIELTPTTAKHPIEGKDISPPTSSAGPMAALAAAGAAVGAAIQSTVGSHSAQKDEPSSARATGDIYNKPLAPVRLESAASSLPPTPPVKDEPRFEVTPAVPAKDEPEHTEDFESDRIHHDIISRLSPGPDEKAPSLHNLDVPTSRAPNRRSDAILSEYESYWAGSEDDEEPQMVATALPTFSPAPLVPKSSKQSDIAKELPAPVPVEEKTVAVEEKIPSVEAARPAPSSVAPSSAQPGFLTQRFSWEMTPADSPTKEIPETSAPEVNTEKAAPPPISKGLQPDPLSLNPKLSSEHLQIRNAEPGELPSPEEPRGPSLESIREAAPVPEEEIEDDEPVSPIRETPAGPRPPSSGVARDASGIRPPSFREILAIKSTPARIAKYNETRVQFSQMDTGLELWLKKMVATDPQLADAVVNTPVHRPTMPSGGTSGSPSPATRHKTTASLTKVFSSGPGDGGSGGGSGLRPSPSTSDRTAVAALKGKDLLNKAGVLGGKGVSKGMKEAKGLFAKGKSRFRSSGSEKAGSPLETSSRRSSITSIASAQSSIFSRPSSSSSRRSSLVSTPPASRRASLDLTQPILCRSSSSSSSSSSLSSSIRHRIKIPDSKKDSDPDDEPDPDPPWSEDWLREQADVTVMAIWSRHKPTPEELETERNTKMNAQRPQTPKANDSTERLGLGGTPAPALPTLEHLRPDLSRNGSSDDLIKSVLKSSNVSSGRSSPASANSGSGLSSLPSRQPMTLAIPDMGEKALMAGIRNSHPRIVSMMGPGESGATGAANGEPVSPVSPVDEEDKFPGQGKAGKNEPGAKPGALRSASSTPRLPGTSFPNATLNPNLPTASPMLRPQSAVGAGDGEPHTRVSFVLNEPKGKEKAMPGSGMSTPVIQSARHIRFDSNTFHPRAKEIKMQKAKKDAEDAARKLGHRKQYSPPLHSGVPRVLNTHAFEQSVHKGQLPIAPQQKRANPESGALSSLHRADSQYDRMAAIANAHRMMREQFDGDNDLSQAPPDLMASETAARMLARQQEFDRMAAMMSGGAGGLPIPSIPESRPQSRDGRSRGNSIISFTERDRSREGRPTNSVVFGPGTPGGHSREPSGSSAMRATSMPRLPPTGGPRANSIPRPESIVGAPGQVDSRRMSLTALRPGTRDGIPQSLQIGFGAGTSLLSISHGQAQSPVTAQSGLNSLPSQQRPVSQIATVVTPVGGPNPRLSAGPGPTIHSEGLPQPQPPTAAKPATPITPSMVITTPEMVSTVQNGSPPAAQNQKLAIQEPKLGPQSSIGGRSEHSVSSMGDASDKSGTASPNLNNNGTSKQPVSPVKKTFETREYQAPNPQKERPMSYVPLARDDRGLPVSEVISTGKSPLDVTTPELEEPEDTLPSTKATTPESHSPKVLGQLQNQIPQKPSLPVDPQRFASAPTEIERNVSAQSDYSDDLYKPPTPRTASAPADTSPTATKPDTPQTPILPLNSNPVANRSIQLYDRPFSRDEGAPPPPPHPSEDKFAPPVPDMNPIAHLQSPNTPAVKKGGLFSKLKGKPQVTTSATASGHSQQSSRDTNSSAGEQRLSSMTSTTASSELDPRSDKQRKRGSGFFSIKRPSSTEPESRPDDGFIPPHPQVRVATGLNTSSSSPIGSDPPTPQRSATTHAGEPAKKRRPTLGSIFSRTASTTTGPPPPPQKESAKTTVFHRVPHNPNPSAWEAKQEETRFSGPRGQNSNLPPLPTDPQSRPGSRNAVGGEPVRPPSFVHAPGASGMAAIDAQRGAQITTTITGGNSGRASTDGGNRKERRSLSLTGGGLFGKKRSDASPSGRGRDRSNSTESTTKTKKIRKRNMGSISESGAIQHQERPWAITFPGAEDNEEDKEIERREIMHASSARWQRGADGQMYVLQEQLSPTSQTDSTPISPHPQPVHQPTSGAHAHPSNQVFSYLPTGAPSQETLTTPDHPTQQLLQEYYSPRPARSVPIQYPEQQYPYPDPEKPEIYQPSAPGQPVIPPLPQENVPLMQPQPRRASEQTEVRDPRRDPSFRSTGASRPTTSSGTSPRAATSQRPSGLPRLDMASRSPNDTSPRAPASAGPHSSDSSRAPPLRSASAAHANHHDHVSSPIGRDRDAPENRPPVPSKHSPPSVRRGPSNGTADPAGSDAATRTFIAALEEERRMHGEHTAMGYSGSKVKKPGNPRAGLHVEVPVTSGAAPPQVGTFSDTSAAVASAGTSAHRRRNSTDSDDAPVVMQATSYPGQEWMPDFYYD